MSKNEKDLRSHASALAEILMSVDSREEMEDLLIDWFTPAERKDLWERWRIVDMLLCGKSQREIRDELKVSISKVTRGSRELQYGTDAFRQMWEKLAKKR